LLIIPIYPQGRLRTAKVTYLLNKQGHSQTFIVESMGGDKSTIFRVLFRNTGKKGYRYKRADRRCALSIPTPSQNL